MAKKIPETFSAFLIETGSYSDWSLSEGTSHLFDSSLLNIPLEQRAVTIRAELFKLEEDNG
jgi:hypothetical protein